VSESPPIADTSLIDASYDAFNRGDREALLALYTEDCVWDMTRWPAGRMAGVARTYQGHEGIATLLEDWLALSRPWGGASTRYDLVEQVAEGRFYIEGRFILDNPAAARGFEDRWQQICETRRGRIASLVMYWDPAEARLAAGGPA
jgi:ketosteroid isomerase-like protein